MKHRILAALASAALAAGCGDNLTHPPDHSTYTGTNAGGAGGALSCLPNLDGVLEPAEMKAVLGVPVSYLIGNDRPVDLVGKDDGSGHLVWDFSKDYATDAKITIQAASLVGKWYQDSFAGGQWVAPADAAGDLEGVYSADDAAIYLHGLASKTSDEGAPGGKTLLVYVQKVAVYRFPLAKGAAWTSESEVTNAIVGNKPYTGTHVYSVRDDATGQLALHDETFTQVHRIRTTLTIKNPQGADIVRRQTGFVFECFGEIVRATAKDDEPSDDFTTAAELRRLGQ